MQRRCQVYRDIVLPIRRAHLLDASLTHGAGIVHQHIQPAGSRDHRADHPRRRIRVGKVGNQGFMRSISPALNGENPRTLSPQPVRNGPADAAPPAGDKRHLVLKPGHITGFPPFTSTSAPHI